MNDMGGMKMNAICGTCGQSDCMGCETATIVTGTVMPMRPETGYENVTDEYLAQQLGGLRLMMQSPQSRAILTEAAIRLVLRGGDDGHHDTRAMTKPTLEGLEGRIAEIEEQMRNMGASILVRDANQGR